MEVERRGKGADEAGAEHHIKLVSSPASNDERDEAQEAFHRVCDWSGADDSRKREK
jgi:ABC-type sugar transport system substrate-binding protein